jgi:hypothetical protein
MRYTKTTTLLLGLLLSGIAPAQTATGSLAGRVLDPNGAVIPGVRIVSINDASAVRVETVSSETGVYVLPTLNPGVYSITFEKQGFKKLNRQNVEIRIAQRLDLDVKLEIGDVSVAVDVSSDLPLLETSTSERGQNFSVKMMNDVPLFTGGIRNPRSFLSLLPGVTSGAGETSVSGSGGRAQEVMIDGGSMTIPESGGTVFNMPSAEMFGEFKLLQSTYSAEYGRFGGGVEIYTTKSGSPRLHGGAFYNILRDIFNANSWANNRLGAARAKSRLTEYGGYIGGPVWVPKVYNDPNKTFFFLTWTKDKRPTNITGTPVNTVPTGAMKGGDFSGAGIPLVYDPATTAGSVRTQFPGNIIPQSRFSRVARNILPFIPNPTRGTLAANFDMINTQVFDRTIWSLKLDHNFAANHRVNFWMSRETQESFDTTAIPGPLGQGIINGQKPWNYRINHDYSFTPTFFMHTLLSESAQRQTWDNPLQDGFGSTFGVPNLPRDADATPRFRFDGPAGLTAWGVQDGKVRQGGQNNDTLMITQGYTLIKGRHEYKFGWDARWLQTLGFDNAGSNGQYIFNRNQTALPTALTSTGHEFASFLLGAPNEVNSVILPALFDPVKYRYYSGYFQDNFRISNRLTLNLGVRYEVPIGWHIPNGFAFMNPVLPNAAAGGRPGAYEFAGRGAGRTGTTRPFPTDFSNIGPRLGFAYKLSSKTVLRGGYGIYYQTLGNGGCGCRDGFSQTNSLLSDGLNAAALLDGGIPPAPGYRPPPNINPALQNFQNASVLGDNFARSGRIQNWSMQVQHEVKSFLIDVSYQGNRGSRLASSIDLNQLPTSELARGSQLQALITSPAGQASNVRAPFDGFGARSVAQALRPYPQYLSVFSRNAGVGRTWYDSLQTKVERRFGTWQLIANHSWSKSLGLAHFRQIFTQLGTAIPQDYYNIDDSKSYLPFDQTQVLNIVNSVDLPFGKGRRYFSGASPAVNKLVSGWTIASVQRYTSGNLIQIVTPGNPLGAGVLFAGVTKANRNQSIPVRTGISRTELDPGPNSTSRWFNVGNYTAAAPFTLGTAAFYDSLFRQPPVLNENLGIVKRTRLLELDKNPIILTLRADAFNMFNRTSFGGVIGAIGNANFGRPTGPQLGARTITMGMRLEF